MTAVILSHLALKTALGELQPLEVEEKIPVFMDQVNDFPDHFRFLRLDFIRNHQRDQTEVEIGQSFFFEDLHGVVHNDVPQALLEGGAGAGDVGDIADDSRSLIDRVEKDEPDGLAIYVGKEMPGVFLVIILQGSDQKADLLATARPRLDPAPGNLVDMIVLLAFPDLDTHGGGLVDGRANHLFLAALEIPSLQIDPDFRAELSPVISVFPMQNVNNRLAHLHELAGRMTLQKLVDDELEVHRVADRVGQRDFYAPLLHEGNVADVGQVEILHPRLHGREGL